MAVTGYCYDERFLWHDTGTHVMWLPSNPSKFLQPSAHVENEDSKRRLHSMLSASGLIHDSSKVVSIRARPATDEELLRFHTPTYLSSLAALSNGAGGDAGEAAQVSPGSEPVARLAAGATIQAADAIMRGVCRNAYVLTRPPGHHAERDRGMGFCLYSNLALAAKHVQAVWGLSRIAVVDFDVHHGNGTQQAFWEDPGCLFLSVHQDGLYPPNTGKLSEVGEGKGRGYNVNVPLPPGCGVGAYQAVMERVFLPALKAYRPQFIFVSAGYDAAAFDQLGRMMLPSAAYRTIGDQLTAAANRLCGGRLLAAHEGGYSAQLVPFCGLRFVEAMVEEKQPSHVFDPFDEEILLYPGQQLLPHQASIVDAAALLVAEWAPVWQRDAPPPAAASNPRSAL